MKCGAIVFRALACAGFLYAQTPTALIEEFSGTVEVRLPGSSQWIPAQAGMGLEKAAMISTGLQSSAVIVIGTSRVMVRPITRLTIEELSAQQNTEQVGLFLQTGRVRAEVRPPAEGRADFTLRSPSSTNSVRGTVFEFDTVQVTVVEGRVWFVPSGGGSAALVRAGESGAYLEAVLPVRLPRAVSEALVPELPPGMENGVAMPEPSFNPVFEVDAIIDVVW